jgi:rod shape-determining protein MreB and related proteins
MSSLLRKLTQKPNIAVDLGTANTRIYSCEKGMIAEEPSAVRMVPKKAASENPDKLIEYLNSKLIAFPLRGGVITDADNAVSLLKPLLKRARSLRPPVSLACAPTDSTDRERKVLAETISSAGASHVAIVPEPWAAAIGAGFDMNSPDPQMLIDIGDGVTDLVVIKDGRLVYTSAIRTACSDLHRAVRSSIIGHHRVSPYHSDIEKLTYEIDALVEPGALFDDRPITVEGVHVVKRCEAVVDVTRREVLKAMEPILYRILQMIRTNVHRLPEKILSDLQGSGICLTGGGSCIKGLDRLIEMKTGLKTRVAVDPMHAVINGAIQAVECWKERDSWWKAVSWPL